VIEMILAYELVGLTETLVIFIFSALLVRESGENYSHVTRTLTILIT